MNAPTKHPARQSVQQALLQRWMALSEREKRLISWGAMFMALAILWWWGLAPALRTVREAPTQQTQLDAQWQQLSDLQIQAQALQKLPRMTPEAALRALQNTTTELLGTGAKLNTTGDRSTVTLSAITPEALARWLSQVRVQARAVPIEAHLERVPNQRQEAAPSATPKPPLWSGSVVLSLPAS